jgi:hypothetical protein
MKGKPVIWRRFGKEHGEDSGFRVNTKEVVRKSLRRKAEKAHKLSSAEWLWTQISDDLIVEHTTGARGLDESVLFYLPKRNWLVIANSTLVPGWPWYVHVGTTIYDPQVDCWVFTNHFADVLVREDRITHTVLDLDNLAEANQIGLIDGDTMSDILEQTQRLVDLIRDGEFPPKEVREYESK